MANARKILIANRGEIACRIMRTCRRLGVATVAVYSDAEREAQHVKAADEAHNVGGPRAQDSYLVTERLLAVARETGASAVHPGYGFLAENAAFARAVMAAGLVWIGPSPDDIDMMGDKQRAREAAVAAGVPVVPGSARFEPGQLDGLEDAAAAVGYPLLAKAAGGGGGIGMRRIDNAEALRSTVEATQSMAVKAFGSGAVYLERLVARARHVEVQVFGFGDGTAVHLFERDCSLQRRFQKVLEETPAPGIEAATLDRMWVCAVALAAATNYSGAGTVEFIVDTETQEFFFLEMNTRIQVEHPVTEMVTGLDLVEMQIKLAFGELDSLAQSQVTRAGAAVEARIYAENPAKMFMPSPGPLNVFILPETGGDVRVDTGYAPGDAVTPYYDPMIAKVIARGRDRAAAIATLRAALAGCRIEGIATNLGFLIACLDHPAFAAGDVDTGFIERNRKALVGQS